jgi:putative membrane protein
MQVDGLSLITFRHGTSHRRRTRQGAFLATAIVVMIALVMPDVTLAHSGPPPTPDVIWRTWNFEPLTVLVLLLGITAYIRGVRIVWQRAGRNRGIKTWQFAAGLGGFLALVIALISPLDPLSSALFSAHMVQHMLLVAVAPVVLILANVQVPYLWSMPRRWRSAFLALPDRAPWLGTTWRAIGHPLPVLILHSLVLWIWHVPALYNAAIRSEVIHMLEHATMLGTAALFWWLVIQRGRRSGMSYGIGVLLIVGVVIQKTALGALITFSPGALYGEYATTTAAWGLTPLEDQQLAGAVMMGPWGVVYLVAGVVLFARWVRAIERSVEREERLEVVELVPAEHANGHAKESV